MWCLILYFTVCAAVVSKACAAHFAKPLRSGADKPNCLVNQKEFVLGKTKSGRNLNFMLGQPWESGCQRCKQVIREAGRSTPCAMKGFAGCQRYNHTVNRVYSMGKLREEWPTSVAGSQMVWRVSGLPDLHGRERSYIVSSMRDHFPPFAGSFVS